LLADYKPAKDDPAVRADCRFSPHDHALAGSGQPTPIDQLVLTIAPDLYHSDDLDRAARESGVGA